VCVYSSSEVTTDLEVLVNVILETSFYNKISPFSVSDSVANDTLTKIWNVVKIRPAVVDAKSRVMKAHIKMKTSTYLIDPKDPFSDVVVLCNFVKQVFGSTPAIFIDGLDDMSDVFRFDQDGNMSALTHFAKAAMAPRLEDMMVTGNIYWMYSSQLKTWTILSYFSPSI
jgi:hypothetical protein